VPPPRHTKVQGLIETIRHHADRFIDALTRRVSNFTSLCAELFSLLARSCYQLLRVAVYLLAFAFISSFGDELRRAHPQGPLWAIAWLLISLPLLILIVLPAIAFIHTHTQQAASATNAKESTYSKREYMRSAPPPRPTTQRGLLLSMNLVAVILVIILDWMYDWSFQTPVLRWTRLLYHIVITAVPKWAGKFHVRFLSGQSPSH